MNPRATVTFALLLGLNALKAEAKPVKNQTPDVSRHQDKALAIAVAQMKKDYGLDFYRSLNPKFYLIQDDEPHFYRFTFLPVLTQPNDYHRNGRLGQGFGVAYFVSKKSMKVRKVVRAGKLSDPIAKKTKIVTEWK